MSVLTALFDSTRRDLRRARALVEQIGALGPQMQQLSDEQMRAKTDVFRDRLAHGAMLDDLLVEAYALVREATWRVLGDQQIRFRVYRTGSLLPDEVILPRGEAQQFEENLKAQGLRCERERYMAHFDVQMMGAIVLHWGRIAEMKTGEGKTQVAVPALYLNALEGKGAHLLTHNDYLAKRDCDWMGPIYEMLGLAVGVIQHDMSSEERYDAYRCDITYATNHEVGFDYLRDNTVDYSEWLVLRELNYAIVDEADSLLIDEARVPLILAGPGTKPTELYRRVDRIVPRLTRDTDYIVDEKSKLANLTEDGVRKVESLLGVTNITDPENLELFQHVNAALRAHACYERDKDYVVRDGKVILVDEFTGRLMFGRRYSEGLHQAIEAKEKVQIERENVTTATITHQNFIRLYKKIAGMTGTAKTEEAEFIKVYDAPVAVVPTHRPMIRTDHPDVIYKTEEAKFHGITAEILQMQSLGRPTLVGTRSIAVSERLSERLKPERLQLLAQLLLLEDALLQAEALTEDQRRELRRALQGRLGEVEREAKHLEGAVAKFDYGPGRITQPEELRRIEQRLSRVSRFGEEIRGLIGKLEGDEGTAGRSEIRRMAEVICYQPLEEVPLGRAAALLRAFGRGPDVTRPENARRLANLIGLEDKEHARLAEVLERGIPHRVLNAKYHEMEAHIIAQAGRSGALTIATNMAGRGVDILLGGNLQELGNDFLRRDGIDPAQASDQQREAAFAEAREICAKDKETVIALGGLHILGTERHESRRIDNQLRGRAGRQGDPGSSRFYISFEDELMRLFGPERLDFFLSRWPENEPIEHKLTSKMIENAQKKVEAHNFEIRKHRLQYDDVMNHQRSLIYEQRLRVLLGEDLRDSIITHLRDLVAIRVKELSGQEIPREEMLEAIHTSLSEFYPVRLSVEQMRQINREEELTRALQEDIVAAYEEREQFAGEEQMRELERFLTLRVANARWVDHLAAMEDLEEGINLRGYSGTDPLIIYRNEAFEYWNRLLATIREDIIRYLFWIEIRPQEVAEQRQAQLAFGVIPQGQPVEAEDADGMAAPAAPVVTQAAPVRQATRPRAKVARSKVGRNEPCPCGSGRKYKKCCGRSG